VGKGVVFHVYKSINVHIHFAAELLCYDPLSCLVMSFPIEEVHSLVESFHYLLQTQIPVGSPH
jgi:hypothetical protein